MNILFIATESVPYCKTGDLADVVHGLASELCVQGHDVRIVIPCYRGVLDRERIEEIVHEIKVSLGNYSRPATVWKSNDKTETYLIEQYFYFDRNNLYGYLDDYERFIFFTRTALEMLTHEEFREKENKWFPQVVQGFDWTTGFIPFWLSDFAKDTPEFASMPFVLSIQNIKDIGVFGSRTLRIAIPQKESRGFFPQIGEETERISFLGRGILSADKLVTVNPEYGPQNPLPESAQHLSSLLSKRAKQGSFIGIRNAIDYDDFNPDKDTRIYRHFNERSLPDRIENKRRLQQEFGFKQDDSIPLIGMVSQLIPEKGLDLFSRFEEQVLRLGDVQFIALLDPVNPHYTEMFREWEKDWKEQRGERERWRNIAFGFDETLARRIYSACDIFLLPSKEDPCGTQQFIAMHYGAIPVIHATGALRDSVIAYQPGMNLDEHQGQGVGFSFAEFTAEAFVASVQTAIELYKTDKQTWAAIQRHNMREEFSWFQPARHYLETYHKLLEIPKTERIQVEVGEPLQLNRDAQLLQTIMEIDSLQGLHVRKPKDLLQQAARLVRELIKCDAVYVWTVGVEEQTGFEFPASQKMQLVSESIAHHETRTSPDAESLNAFLNQGSLGTLNRFSDLNRGMMCQPIPNLSGWELSQKEGWTQGWFVPITAHGRIWGRIDVLFTEDGDSEWLTRALTTLANSFGFRLEEIRLAQESKQILETDNELLSAQSFTEVVHKVVDQAKRLSHADEAWLYVFEEDTLKLIESTAPTTPPASVSLEIARSAATTKDVVYIADVSTILYKREEGFLPFRSLIAVPLINKFEDELIGVIEVAKRRAADFSRDDERVLKDHLAPQAAAILKTTRRHAQQEQNRIEQLKKLAASLIGGGSFQRLLDDIVTTTAEVLEAQSASLYLLDRNTNKLVIQAAAGYHRPWLQAEEKASYQIGEGLTGWIAQTGELFKADSVEELHAHPVWKGKYLHLQESREPDSFLGTPLKVKDQVIGVMKIEDKIENSPVFTDEDVRLAEIMANIIATVVYNTQISNTQLQKLSSNLEELSKSLAGGREMRDLVDQIVETIARVLGAEASSLYLIDEATNKLVIQAATGYQKPLVDKRATYTLGEGLTGWIAAEGKLFRANNLDELRTQPAHKGKQDHDQGDRKPQSFLGLPLKVVDRFTNQEKVIGVLKVEDIVPSSNHPEKFFTEQDVLLVTMMANVIATVVHNTQMSNAQFQKLSNNLKELSIALAGGREMRDLVDQIVETIWRVLGAEASSLYLIDEATNKLVIQAATGYQKPLVDKRATYTLGEGLTGWIAAEGKLFRANNLDELQAHPAHKGKQDHDWGDRKLQSFLGLPLKVVDRFTNQEKVIGVLKVEDIVPSPSHPEKFFTEQDVLLVTMMANTIATVVYNTQASNAQLEELSSNLEKLSVALAGGLEMRDMVSQIVKTIIRVLGAEASSLYLIDEATGKLLVQAVSGYSKPLVTRGALYSLGEGVTGWIAATGKLFRANSLDELHKHPNWKGKCTSYQGGREPNSFLGLPLKVVDRFTGEEKVIGVLKIEEIVPYENHPEVFFTDQDVLLVEMMANIINDPL